ncbi:U2 snRNP-associated SURP motif-containing protein-like isoform X2 [Culex pipiens pallens]|uniref:U2 snRNP-associated SURP motif-containing protein-like isoform X2 n=1 Tax=Culex pipiens pallens TaxID=42434 RepID=UPI001954CDAC|nr:U2 snRNP-associated SURP motif-containing protein-like isoform X2 [Culex pipiens pallens]
MNVMNVFKAWEEWADYPKNFLLRLQHTFLGIAIVEKQPEEVPALLKGIADTDSRTPVLKHDIYNDGMPLNTTEDIDGVPMQSSEKKLKTGGPVLPSTPAEATASVKRPFYRSKPAASPPIGEDSQNGQITGEGHAGLSTNCWWHPPGCSLLKVNAKVEPRLQNIIDLVHQQRAIDPD